MLSDDQKEALVAGAKLGSVWSAVGISNWSDAASAAAFFLSVLFIAEFIWKKMFRPFLERKHVVKRKQRRKTDFQELE